MLGSGNTTLIILNEEIYDNMKIIKSLKKSVLLIKAVNETKNEAKEQKGGFFRMLLGTLGASLLVNLLTGKGAIAMSQGRKANMPGWGTIKVSESTFGAGEGIVRANQDF